MTAKERAEKQTSFETVWVVDACPRLFSELNVLGRFNLRYFEDLASFREAMRSAKGAFAPQALIVETHIRSEDVFKRGEVLKWFAEIPFFAVSSSSEPHHICLALDLGATDYLLKPVNAELLGVKVDRLLRTRRQNQILVDLKVDYFSLSIQGRGGSRVKLTLKEFQILTVLGRHFPGSVMRETLRELIWGKVSVGAKTLDVHLFKLRRALVSAGLEIECQKGSTYRLIRREWDPES